MKGIQVCQLKGHALPSGDNKEIAKIHRQNLKNIFSRTTGPISTIFGTYDPWMGGVQVCSNERPCPLIPNREIIRNTCSKISTELGTKHPQLKGTRGFTNYLIHSIFKKEIMGFCLSYTCITIAFLKCVN